MNKWGAAILALLVGTAAPAVAGTTIYECTVTSDTGWINSPVIIAHQDGASEADAADPMIQSAYGKPIKVDLSVDNNAKITFKWTILTTNRSGQTTQMLYRATILKPNNKFVMSAIPQGYANTFRGEGTCKVSRKK